MRRSMRTKGLPGAKRNDAFALVYEIDDEDDSSKHRTGWVHDAEHSHRRKEQMRKKEFNQIPWAAPHSYWIFPRAKRSERRVRCKYLASKLRKKLDSESFTQYLERLWKSFSEDRKASFAYLDSLWFCLYRDAGFRNKVMTWIARKHIFLKKYVFVPIVCWGHWNLLILCNFGESLRSESRSPCMLLLDSLQMADPRRLELEIRKFVMDVYKVEGRTSDLDLVSKIPLLIPKVPQQRDDDECGSFVLYYIFLFMKDAPDAFSIEGYPYFMDKDWFTHEGLDNFCRRLDSLVNRSSCC